MFCFTAVPEWQCCERASLRERKGIFYRERIDQKGRKGANKTVVKQRVGWRRLRTNPVLVVGKLPRTPKGN